MIKLVLNPKIKPVSYTFNKKTVIIGSIQSFSSPPDIVLSHANIKPLHIKIVAVDDHFYAFNVAEDPFTTLNKVPFNKKKLYSGDLFDIHGIQLQFEGVYNQVDENEPITQLAATSFNIDEAMLDLDAYLDTLQKPSKDQIFQEKVLDNNMENKFLQGESLDLHVEEKLPSAPLSLSFLPQEIPLQITFDESAIPLPLQEEIFLEEQDVPLEQDPIAAYKSIHNELVNIEAHSTKRENAFFSKPKRLSISSKKVILGFSALFTLMGILITCLYIATSEYNVEEEIRAAQAVSDVAMALNFAQINDAEQNQNWSDPDFLKHNLHAVLASEYAPLAHIDSQGQFNKIAYSLRIYTAADLGHYLIIAQPIPGLFEWLLPKAAIIVNSTHMVLRKITDLKTLNRLLVNATLDTTNSKDIADFVNLGELLSLNDLKNDHLHTGFDCPKLLSCIYPGAENLIYNAIRYYPMGESLAKKALTMYNSDDNGQDLLALIDRIGLFTKFPNIVLYSSYGVKSAYNRQRALTTFFPKYKFLHGYLQFNAENVATSSHLLLDDHEDQTAVAFVPFDDANEYHSNFEDPNVQEIDQNHPLYYKLMVLQNAREHSLKILGDQVKKEQTQKVVSRAVQEKYQRIINNLQEKIIKAISVLQQEYSTMPFGQFMRYIKATKLESLIQENIRKQTENPMPIQVFDEALNNHISKIEQTTLLRELYNYLNATLQILTLESVPNPQEFIAYQNKIHSTVMRKLDAILLSPHLPLPAIEQKVENRTMLAHILKGAWVIDEGEYDYYIDEFNELLPE